MDQHRTTDTWRINRETNEEGNEGDRWSNWKNDEVTRWEGTDFKMGGAHFTEHMTPTTNNKPCAWSSGLCGLPDWSGLWSGLCGFPDWSGLWNSLQALKGGKSLPSVPPPSPSAGCCSFIGHHWGPCSSIDRHWGRCSFFGHHWGHCSLVDHHLWHTS